MKTFNGLLLKSIITNSYISKNGWAVKAKFGKTDFYAQQVDTTKAYTADVRKDTTAQTYSLILD